MTDDSKRKELLEIYKLHANLGAHPIFFGYGAAARQALHLRKSGQRIFSRQHLMANGALAPAFDQRHPAVLNRLPKMYLHTLFTTLYPTGNPCFR